MSESENYSFYLMTLPVISVYYRRYLWTVFSLGLDIQKIFIVTCNPVITFTGTEYLFF